MSTRQRIGESTNTYVVELTPRGRAAVAVVLVVGPSAVAAADECFHSASGRTLADTPVGRIVLGRWRAGSSPTPFLPAGDPASGKTAGRAPAPTPNGEELIACRRSHDRLEFHCHGGVAAVRAVVQRLCECGCQAVPWQDWLQDADPDPIRVAAQIALSTAPTARTATVLLDQFHGALAAAIRAALAAAADGQWQTSAATVDAMLAHRGVGEHLTSPWRVVLAGPPNVGKSSLKNALVGYQRAIVCHLPGTTRDVVTTMTAIDGWPIQLADTAGLRDATDEVEAAGVARAATALAAADLVVLIDEVADRASSCGLRIADCRLADSIRNRLPATMPVIRVLNKIDLLSATQRAGSSPTQRAGSSPTPGTAGSWDELTSVLTGEGIERLIAAIGQRLVSAPPVAGAAVPFTADQIDRLTEARAAAERRDAAALAVCLKPLLAD